MRILICVLTIIICAYIEVAYAHTATALVESAFEDMEAGESTEAVAKLFRAARANDVIGQYYLGLCYEQGLGTSPDKSLAFRYFRKAAERGFAPAMKELTRCYRYGIGVTASMNRAEEWEARYENKGLVSPMPDIVKAYDIGLNRGKKYSNNQILVATQLGTNTPSSQNEMHGAGSNSSNMRAVADENSARQPEIPSNGPLLTEDRSTESSIVSDIDFGIPKCSQSNDNIFALIIANENYQDAIAVPFAHKDGESVYNYLNQTYGIPASNIKLMRDATLNNIKREVNYLTKLAEAYEGKASFIIYYAGHGLPDESSHDAFIMPIDGYAGDTTTCYSVADFYRKIGEMPSVKTIVIMDACFSGSVRGDGMVASARGVMIKPNASRPSGNTVVISSTLGNETAYPYKEQEHGLFTYCLLKAIKDTDGNIALADLMERVRSEVIKLSLVVNHKQQTPSISTSVNVADSWKTWNFN